MLPPTRSHTSFIPPPETSSRAARNRPISFRGGPHAASARLFRGSLTYEPSQTHTANSGVTDIGIYRGETYSADASATFVLSQTTDFSLGWYFSGANFGQPKTIAPVGIRYQEHTSGSHLHVPICKKRFRQVAI